MTSLASAASNNIQAATISQKKISEIITTSEHAVDSIWHYPLLTVDKNHVTLGNIVFAFVVLLLGIWYFNKLKHKLRAFLHAKFTEDKDAANAVENIITYVLLIIFVSIILQVANVPLSTFAFVGGALAIGVGLGAQNLINNFISSLIIMIERPLKMGDIVQIENIHGKVVSIGARCVTIQTNRMTDVLVPNSKLIQENLINWSLTDDFTRGFVEIRFYKNHFCKMGQELGGAPSASEYPGGELIIKSFGSKDHNPEIISEKISDIFRSFDVLMESKAPEVYFNGVDNRYYNYQVVFLYDTKKTRDLYRLKSQINLEIAKCFDLEDMIIEYSKASTD